MFAYRMASLLSAFGSFINLFINLILIFIFIYLISNRKILILAQSSKGQGEIVDLWVSIYVIDNGLQTGSGISLNKVLSEVLDDLDFVVSIRNLGFLFANLLSFIAYQLDTSLAVSAQQCEASWHHNDWVSVDHISLGSSQCNQIKMGSPVLVTNSRGSECDDLDPGENLLMIDVDERNNRESPTETDASNNESIQLGLNSDFSEVSEHILLYFLPHVIVGLLNFAVRAGVLILDLEGIQDVLPHVQGSISVPEGQDHKSRVHAHYALDIHGLFLDNMGMGGLVGAVAHLASPLKQIFLVIPSNNQRVSQGHLVFIGDRRCKIGKEEQNKCCSH